MFDELAGVCHDRAVVKAEVVHGDGTSVGREEVVDGAGTEATNSRAFFGGEIREAFRADNLLDDGILWGDKSDTVENVGEVGLQRRDGIGGSIGILRFGF
jgi:hypothetical protein